MSEEQSMSVKAHLDVGGGKYEVRRFGLPEAMATNFTCMKEKVCGVFGLSGQPIRISWKDTENDDIVISSDEELMEAIADSVSRNSTNLFRIYVTVGARPDLGQDNSFPGTESGALHEGVTCDGCEEPIRGFRYKCMHCKDFDLCSTCEHKGKHHEHRMMRIPTPRTKGGPKFWWREHGAPAGHFSASFGVNTDNGANSSSQSSSDSASGRCGAEGGNFSSRHGCGRGRHGRGSGVFFGRPRCGAWMRGFGYPVGSNMPGTPCSSQNQQHKQCFQKENSQKQQQQQKQQQSCANNRNAEFSDEAACEAARAAEEAGKMAEEVAAQASQFVSQFASQVAPEQVANMMKDIFTALSGQEGAQTQTSASTMPQCNTGASNSNTGTNHTQSENNSGKEADKMAEEVAAQASQFANQFASQIGPELVGNMMSGIFTALTGQEGAQAQASAGAPHGNTGDFNSNAGTNHTQRKNNSDKEANKMAEEVSAQASQFANQFASQIGPEQVGNMMRDIFTALSGQESAQPRSTTGAAPQSNTTASKSNTSNNHTQSENNSVDHSGIHQQCASAHGNGSNNRTTPTTSAGAATTSSTPSAPVTVTTTQSPPLTPVATAIQTPIVAATHTTQTQQANSTLTAIIPSSEQSVHISSQEPEQMEVTSLTNIQKIDIEADHSSGEWTVINESPITGIPSAPSHQAMSNGCAQGAQTKSPQAVNYPSLTELHPPTPQHPNPVIQRAVDHMIAMGYNNEDGWLTQLLEAKQGDMNKVLDLLQPAKKM